MGGHITNNIQVLHEDQPVEEDEEEALSLCDLPLDLDTDTNPRNYPLQSLNHTRTRKSTPEAAFEFFEFHNVENGSDMCPADDIISGGILVPRKRARNTMSYANDPSRFPSYVAAPPPKTVPRFLGSVVLWILKRRRFTVWTRRRGFHRRKAPANPRFRLRRWYVFMFGSVKFPPDMELQDIKSRQFRRNPSVMFSDDGKKVTDNNRGSDKSSSSWSLLKALSCRDYTSVAVTSSFYLHQA